MAKTQMESLIEKANYYSAVNMGALEAAKSNDRQGWYTNFYIDITSLLLVFEIVVLK